jgi:acetyl esterase/lipase
MTRPAFLAALLLPVFTMAQETIPLWPANAIPNNKPGITLPEKSVTEGGILRISDVTVPTLTIYRPAKPIRSGASVLICPGGGYWILAAGHEGADMAQWFAERGYTAFVLKYRLPDERTQTNPHEVPLSDAQQAMRLIRQRAVGLGIDPNRVGVMGFSAGGHLAATLATHSVQGPHTDPQAAPNFAILLYPVILFGGEKAHTGSRDKLLGTSKADSTLLNLYSNEKQVSAKTPPAFLVHSMDDKGVPVENSLAYYRACRLQNVPAEMHLYPTGGHGYGLRTKPGESVSGWPSALENWMKGR